MGRAMDGNNGRTPPSSGVEKAVERAEHEARMVGRLADLKIGASQPVSYTNLTMPTIATVSNVVGPVSWQKKNTI